MNKLKQFAIIALYVFSWAVVLWSVFEIIHWNIYHAHWLLSIIN